MYAVIMTAEMEEAALTCVISSLKDFHTHFKTYIFR